MGNSTHLRGGAYGDVGHALLRLELLSADWVEGAQLREVLKQRRPLVRKACQPHGTLALNKLLFGSRSNPPWQTDYYTLAGQAAPRLSCSTEYRRMRTRVRVRAKVRVRAEVRGRVSLRANPKVRVSPNLRVRVRVRAKVSLRAKVGAHRRGSPRGRGTAPSSACTAPHPSALARQSFPFSLATRSAGVLLQRCR